MIVAMLFTVGGAVVAAAPTQWRNGRWLASGRWVVRRISPFAVPGAPAAGTMLASIGWMLVWPPAVVPAIGAAIWWLWRMRESARRAGADLPAALRPSGPQGAKGAERAIRPGTESAARRAATARGTHRRTSRPAGDAGRRELGEA